MDVVNSVTIEGIQEQMTIKRQQHSK